MNNGDIHCNEAHKVRLGGAPGADPQFVWTWFAVQRTNSSGLRDLSGCPLRFFTSLPGSPFVVKVVAWLRETIGVIVKVSLHSAIVYGPEPGKLAEMVVGEVRKIGRNLVETVTGNEKVAREDQW
ncbi:hypothetical protein JHK85_001485 [Glycine max]|nr:hypothetical protein JHK85_001485 [Glycine max]